MKPFIPNLIVLTTLALCLPSRSSAYISEVSIWKSKDSRQTLFMGKEIHNLGSKKENIAQLKSFMDEVVYPAYVEQKKLEILFEGLYIGSFDLKNLSSD